MTEITDREQLIEDMKGLSVVGVCAEENVIHLQMSDGSVLVIFGAIGHYRVPKETH